MESVVGKNNLSQFLKPTPTVEPKAEPTPTPVAAEPKATEPTPTPVTPTPEPTPIVEPAATPEPTPASATPEPVPTPDPTPTPQEVAIDDDAIKAYFKDKYGKEVENVDSLFKEPEPTVDPYEGLSDSARQYLEFNKQTGRDYNEYQALNRDVDQLSSLDIAREKAIKQSGGALSKDDVDAYLEKKLNIDLSDPKNLEKFDQIELNTFGGDYKNQLLEDKKKYATPIERTPSDTDMVTLDNGTQMRKADYDAATAQRTQYLEEIQKASDKITASSYDIKIDDNGTEKIMPLSYDYSKQDVLDMASNASDIDNAFTKLFGNEKGSIDHAKLQEGLHWADASKRGKSINAIVHKALAKQAEEFMSKEYNVKVNPKQMPSTPGAKRVPLPGQKPVSNGGYLQHFKS